MTCTQCGARKTPTNEHGRCEAATAWFRLWPDHEWIDEEDDAVTNRVAERSIRFLNDNGEALVIIRRSGIELHPDYPLDDLARLFVARVNEIMLKTTP